VLVELVKFSGSFLIIADLVREISQQSSDRSKKGGTSYWTMDFFRNGVGGSNF
jgi:hypothetical protein